METLLDFQTKIPENKKTLNRKRLLNKLNKNLNYNKSVTVLSAPAGYGKTTLTADWLKSCSQKKAWFTVDENLNSPIFFIKGIIKALTKNSSILFKNTETVINSPLTLNAKSTAITLIRKFQAADDELILVIDNFNLVKNDFILKFTGFLVEYLPENLHLVILSRKDQPQFLKRHKINSEIIEINKEELSFNYLELTQLFKNIMNLNLSNSTMQSIFKKTEGWPAALDFIVLKLSAVNKKEEKVFVDQLIVENDYLEDYLLNEVLEDLTKEERVFLEQTVVLNTFTPELCDYLRGNSNSSFLINKLAEYNLLLV